MTPFDILKAKRPSLFEYLIAIFTALIAFVAVLLVIPAFLGFLNRYIKEKKFDRQKGSAGQKPLHISIADSLPISVVPVSEMFRGYLHRPNPVDLGKSIGIQVSEDAEELAGKRLEEILFDNEEGLISAFKLGDLKAPSRYFATLTPVRYSPEKTSAFRKLLPSIEEFPEVNIIPEGFLTDFASIPFRPSTGSFSRAAIVHDWGYSFMPLRNYEGRRLCDFEMLDLMRHDGTSPSYRSIIFVGLRLFGGLAFLSAPYRRKKLQSIKLNPAFLDLYSLTLINQFQFSMQVFESPVWGLLEEGTSRNLQNTMSQKYKEKVFAAQLANQTENNA